MCNAIFAHVYITQCFQNISDRTNVYVDVIATASAASQDSVAELGTKDRTGNKDSFGTDVYSWRNKGIEPKMY
jgi:hypothetical protein